MHLEFVAGILDLEFLLKNNSIVRKQSDLIGAGGSSLSKASKLRSLDRLLIIFVQRHFQERFPKEIRSKRPFMHYTSLWAATE